MQRPAEEEAVTPKELRELADMADHIRAVEVGAEFPDWLQDLLDMATALRDHADLCEALEAWHEAGCPALVVYAVNNGRAFRDAMLAWWRARKGTR